MLIFCDSRLAVDVFPTRVILQLLSKLSLHLQELPYHLSLSDHKLLLDGHVGRRRRSVTPACTKAIRGSTSLSHHLKPMRFSLVPYSQACSRYPQEEYAE
jgi:hypothetical protein